MNDMIIPDFPRYTINESGRIRDTERNVEVSASRGHTYCLYDTAG